MNGLKDRCPLPRLLMGYFQESKLPSRSPKMSDVCVVYHVSTHVESQSGGPVGVTLRPWLDALKSLARVGFFCSGWGLQLAKGRALWRLDR